MITGKLLAGKNILLRADLDVPVKQGRVENDYRLRALLPTLNLCLENADSTLIIGHLGRPDGPDSAFSLNPVREWFENALHQSISFSPSGFSPGEWARGGQRLSMFENLRFSSGELNNDREFATRISAGANLYVYEAFAAYNSGASLQKIPEIIPTYTGLRFDREVEVLSGVIKNRPTGSLLVLSGAKEDKLPFVDKFVDKFDEILVGGKLAQMVSRRENIIPANLTEDGLDIDTASTTLFAAKIMAAKQVVINGPLGKFEDGTHALATKTVFEAARSSPAFILVGGGDTLAAITDLGFRYEDFGFVSTGGGAMLEFLATLTHPLLEVIRKQFYAPYP